MRGQHHAVPDPRDTGTCRPRTGAGPKLCGPSIGEQLGFGDVETTSPALEGDDALLGLRAYYDVDMGGYILRGGLQYDFADIDLSNTATLEGVTRIAGRVGAESNGIYFYGTAGYANAQTDIAGSSDGYFLGGGYEQFVADNVTVGAELLFHRFEDFDIPTLDADATTLSVGANFRF